MVQKVFFESRYDVTGHAGEHLSSATTPFLAAPVMAILLYATPRARRQPAVLVTSVAWVVSTVLVHVGNLRVVDALVQVGMGRTATSDLVEDAYIASAHNLANLAPWLGVLAALALTGVLWRHRHVSGRVAIGAAVLNVVFPPWIIPGAGVLVLAVARCIAYARGLKPEADLRSSDHNPRRPKPGGDKVRTS